MTGFARLTIGFLAGLALAGAGVAQVPITQQNGRLFDVNPQIGSGGVNAAVRPYSPFLGGNAAATGNIRGGLSLRSFSPISDPTAFRGSLGSASLSSFIRDSVGVSDAFSSSVIGGPAAFYDPASTVPTAGSLRQFSTPGISRAPGDNVSRPLPGLLNFGGSERFDTRFDAGETGGQFGAATPLASSIFGVTRIPTIMSESPVKPYVPTPTDFRVLPKELREPSPTDAAQRDASADAVANGRVDLRISPQIAPLPVGTSLESLLKGDTAALLGLPDRRVAGNADQANRAFTARGANSNRNPDARLPGRNEPPKTITPPVPALRDLSMLPGYDVFNDMRLAEALKRDPSAQWWTEMLAQSQSMPESAQKAELAQLDAQSFIQRTLRAPMKSFVGKGASPLNDELLRAESFLELGEYQKASERYARAATLDPINPLPMIGRGHALLAEGNYLSAAVSLTRGLQNLPDLADYNVDLTAFFATREIIDKRRADMMKELEQREQPELRFLLGYLEFFGGERALGIENLKKAAAEADYGTIIKRFPEAIQGELPLMPAAPAGEKKDGE